MGFVNRAIVAAGLGFAVSALVGCGASGSLLSHDQAGRLSSELASASQALNDDQCSRAQSAITAFDNSVNALDGVDQTLVANLQQGAQTVASLAQVDCPSGGRVPTGPTQTLTRTIKTRTDTTATDTATGTTATHTQTQTQTQTSPTTPTTVYTYPNTTPTTAMTGTGADTTP
ncbi:MAG: hypothetical protein ACRDKL_05690, partial [Solirubrobacteraceae bacterium]